MHMCEILNIFQEICYLKSTIFKKIILTSLYSQYMLLMPPTIVSHKKFNKQGIFLNPFVIETLL